MTLNFKNLALQMWTSTMVDVNTGKDTALEILCDDLKWQQFVPQWSKWFSYQTKKMLQGILWWHSVATWCRLEYVTINNHLWHNLHLSVWSLDQMTVNLLKTSSYKKKKNSIKATKNWKPSYSIFCVMGVI